MKKPILLILAFMMFSICTNVFAQRETPAGAGDKNLAEDGVKLRSVELERVKREADQALAASFAPISKDMVKKFPEIKEDFEGIQLSQSAIITAYTTGKTIDYATIESSAEQINKKAKRLDSNLFDPKTETNAEDKSATKEQKAKSIRDLIIDLDTVIGSFVSSKIFNVKVIEADVAIKTRTDLDEIRLLSSQLSAEAKKMK